MSASDSVNVTSEVGRLRKVLVHAPGPEWDLVPCGPGALEQYLIEDLFVLSEAQVEHSRFTDVIRLFVGEKNVVEFEDKLQQVCGDERIKQEIVGAVTALESLGEKTCKMLMELDPAPLARALICGAIITQDNKTLYRNLFRPIPNLIFSRDVGAAVPGGFIACHAAKDARRRETLLMRYVLRSDIFDRVQVLDIRDDSNAVFWAEMQHVVEEDPGRALVSIEGGDILVIDRETLMVGVGERTTEAGLALLLEGLLTIESPVRRVIMVKLPEERAHMHLDTVFTVISTQEFMVYSPVLNRAECWVYSHPYLEDEEEEKPLSFDEALKTARLEHMQRVECGYENDLFRSREQWTDGANVFALAPGILLGYDRNQETVKALKAQQPSYRYLDARKQMEEIEVVAQELHAGHTEQRVMIGLPGSELSRARGGPRCMTMPLLRDSL